LPALWDLALSSNPLLREAAADVEAARGQLIQARKYPNPHIAYNQEQIGTTAGPPGTLVIHMTQEIVTAHKRRLDIGIASRGADVASIALLGRQFDVLTRIRRGYYDYLAWQYTAKVNEQVVGNLEQGLEITRKLVEQVKSRPRTDMLRLQSLLEEARINQATSGV